MSLRIHFHFWICYSAPPTQIFLLFLQPPHPSLLATCFCLGLPKSSEQAYIEFESIEAIVKTASRTKFFIEFYSTCLEGEKNTLHLCSNSSTRSYSTDRVSVTPSGCNKNCICFFFSCLSPSLPISGSQYTFKLESIFWPVLHPHLLSTVYFWMKCNRNIFLLSFPPLLPTSSPLSSLPSTLPCISLSLSVSHL